MFYSLVEVAEKLSVHRNTVLNWIENDKLKAYKVGNVWRIADKDLIDFIQDGNKKEEKGHLKTLDYLIVEKKRNHLLQQRINELEEVNFELGKEIWDLENQIRREK